LEAVASLQAFKAVAQKDDATFQGPCCVDPPPFKAWRDAA